MAFSTEFPHVTSKLVHDDIRLSGHLMNGTKECRKKSWQLFALNHMNRMAILAIVCIKSYEQNGYSYHVKRHYTFFKKNMIRLPNGLVQWYCFVICNWEKPGSVLCWDNTFVRP
jgi:hypothetical protein